MKSKVEKLQKKSSSALSLIRKLIDKLEQINDSITKEVSGNIGLMNIHEETILELETENRGLLKMQGENTVTISNFKKLLGE